MSDAPFLRLRSAPLTGEFLQPPNGGGAPCGGCQGVELNLEEKAANQLINLIIEILNIERQ